MFRKRGEDNIPAELLAFRRDDVPEDIIDTLPEVDDDEPAQVHEIVEETAAITEDADDDAWAEEPGDAPSLGVHDDFAAHADTQQAIEDMRQRIDAAIAHQIDEMQQHLTSTLDQMQARIQAAEDEAHILRDELERARADNERYVRKFEALREITQD